MTESLGKCNDAFEIPGRGTVLAYRLYCKETIDPNDIYTVHVVKDGIETHQLRGSFTMILGGKKHRYDMDPYSLHIIDKIARNEILESTVYVDIDVDFWKPKEDHE